MSYGLQVTGNDAGGNFTVADTDLSMVNMVISQSGRASSITLPGGLQKSDFIFVRNPSAVNGGTYSPIVVTAADIFGAVGSTTISQPYVYSIETEELDKSTINFIGTGWAWTPRGVLTVSQQKLAVGRFDVEMDYFVARKASTIIDNESYNNDVYGLQLFTEAADGDAIGEIALDSRSFTSNKTFYIEGYMPPESTFGEVNDGQASVLTHSSGCYINLEWSNRPRIFNDVRSQLGMVVNGIGMTPTTAFTMDTTFINDLEIGEPGLFAWTSHNAIFAAKMGVGISAPGAPDEDDDDNTGGPPTGPETPSTGSITYASGTLGTSTDSDGAYLTEGGTISFDVTTSEVGSYHTRVFRLSGSDGGSGKDFVSVTHPFTSTSETVTLNTYDTNSVSQTFDKTFSQAYTGTYTSDRTSTFARGVDSSYTRDFTGDFIGNYSRPHVFTGDFVGNYTGQVDYTRDFTRGSTFTRNYLRTSTRTSSRTDLYTRPVSYLGNYERTATPTSTRTITTGGSFSRDFTNTSAYIRTSTTSTVLAIENGQVITMPTPFVSYFTRIRNSSFAGNYTRSSAGSLSYLGEYARTSTRTRYSAYSDTYSRARYSIYTRDRVVNSTSILEFAGNYTRGFVGDYARTITSTRTVGISYEGNYAGAGAAFYVMPNGEVRVSSHLYTRVSTASYLGNYTRDFVSGAVRTENYTRTSTRTLAYSRTRTTDYVGNYANTYARTRAASYTGNYTRTGYYANAYTRSYTANTPYARAFTRTTSGSFSGTSYNRSLYYARTFVGNYSRALAYTRTTSSFSYSSSPKHYWLESPDTESGPGGFDPISGGLVLTEVEVFNGGALVASTMSTQFTNVSYIQNINGTYWHKGPLQNTIGDNKYYSIALSSSVFPPANTTTSYTRTADYTRNRSVGYARIANYSLVRTSSYIGNYTRNYVSGTVRTESYSRNSTRTLDYTRASAASYTGNYTRNFAGNYVGNFAGNYTRDGFYTGDYTRSYTDTATTFTGNYTRNRAASYTGNYTRTFVGVYVGNFAGNYTRPSTYSRTRFSTYTRESTRVSAYSSSYIGNYTRLFAGNYVGDYARGLGSEYIGNYTRTRIAGTSYTGDFSGTRNLDYTGTYTRTAYHTFIGNFTRTITRASAYSGTRDAVSTYIGNYVGNYTRDRASTLSYSRPLTFAGAFVGDYSRTSTNNALIRTSAYSRNVAFTRTRIEDFTRPIISTRNSTGIRTSSYTRTDGSEYTRDFTANYVGDYIGNYISSSTRTPSNTSEIGWQGERFVIELRRGSDADSMMADRGVIAVLDSKEFTLYDDDHGLFVSTSPQVIHHTATTHDVTFDFYTEGTSLVPARIYRGSSIIVSDFNLLSNQRTTKTVNEVPPAGSSYTYSLRVWNGNAWIVSSYYVVNRISNTDYVPPTTTYTPTYTAPPVYYTNTGGPNNNIN